MDELVERQNWQDWRKIKEIIRSGVKVKLRWMPPRHGEICLNEIVLNPRYDLLPTLLHECFHFLYPDRDEIWIRRRETELSQWLSMNQWRTLLILLASLI